MELNLKKTILPPTCDGYFREVEIFITEKTTEFSYDKVIEHGKSNFDGTYTFQLVPGEYSLFVKNEMGQIIPSSYTYSPNYYYPDFSINESEITVKDIQLCESLIYVTH